MTPRIAIAIIATGSEYQQYAIRLISQVRRRFTTYPKKIFVFTDARNLEGADEVIQIEHLPMPLPSLLRYHWMYRLRKRLAEYTHFYYLDADLEIIQSVGNEVIAPLIAVRHWGWPLPALTHLATFENREESTAFVNRLRATIYVQASLQGGEVGRYFLVVKELRDRINADLNRGPGRGGLISVWWDESHWNWWVNQHLKQMRILPPEYAQGDPKWSHAAAVLRSPIISIVPKSQTKSWKWNDECDPG